MATFSKVNYSTKISESERQMLKTDYFKQESLRLFQSIIAMNKASNKPLSSMRPLYRFFIGRDEIKLLSKLGFIEVYYMESDRSKQQRLMIKPTAFGLSRFNKSKISA